MKLEPELRDEFMAAAAAVDRPASQIMREFMREYVQDQRQLAAHDAWFRGEVRQSLAEAADPAIQPVPNEQASEAWRNRRAALRKRAGFTET